MPGPGSVWSMPLVAELLKHLHKNELLLRMRYDGVRRKQPSMRAVSAVSRLRPRLGFSAREIQAVEGKQFVYFSRKGRRVVAARQAQRERKRARQDEVRLEEAAASFPCTWTVPKNFLHPH